MSYFLSLISYFLSRKSYFLSLISYFLSRKSYFLSPISYLLFRKSYFLSPISYFLFLFLFLISYLIFPKPSYAAYDSLTDGLVGWWQMDEITANTCSGGTNDSCDESGNKLDGAWTGNTTFNAGKFGNGTVFDGNDDYISVNDNSILEPQNEITVSAWVKLNALPTTSSAKILYKLHNSSPWESYELYIDTSHQIVFGWANSSGTIFSSGYFNTITTNTWYHVVGVKNQNSIILYVNGIPVDDTNGWINYPSIPTGVINNSDGSLFFGQNGWNTEELNGTLDDARIYNRALSPAEVRQLYNYAPPPVAYYPMDENTGSIAYDRSGNNNTGTIQSDITTNDWVPGKFGSSIYFGGNGNNDRIIVNDSGTSTLDITNGITISGWVFRDSIGTFDNIVVKGVDSGTTNNYQFYITDTNKPEFDFYNAGWNTHTGITSINAGQWYYLTVSYNLNQVKIYVNGILDLNESESSLMLADNETVKIGSAGTTLRLQGKLDDLRIYNYARTQSQIIEDMNAGHPVGGSPVGSQSLYLKFDEGYGDTAYDSSPLSNNGDLGAATCSTPGTGACPTWTSSGKFGNALTFDGGDYLTVANESNYDYSSEFSYSAWVKKGAGITDYAKVISKPLTSASWWEVSFAMGIDTAASNSLVCYFYTGSTWPEAVASNILTDTTTWHHVFCNVKYSPNIIEIWIDGELRGSTTFTGSPQLNDGAVHIGATTAGQELWTGDIDEVKIYATSVTADQILMEYNRGKAVVLGSTGTDFSGNADNSQAREFCVPGDTSTCNPPVGWWKMDENTGTSTTYDSSGNNNSGSLQGSMTTSDWIAGKTGSALEMDGSDDFVSITDNSVLDFSTALTLQGWIKPVATAADHVYISKWGDFQDSYNFGTDYTYGTELRIALDQSGSGSISYDVRSDGANLQNNKWQFVAVTWDTGPDEVIFYLDGIRQTTTLNGGASPTSLFNGTAPLRLGAEYTFGYFPGAMDEVRVYNYARTPAQIAWDFNQGAPIGWWKLDECNGTTAYDSAQNGNGDSRGNTGTITIGATGSNTTTGSCSSGTSTEAWNNGTNGKRNASLDFDGSDDYVQITDTANLRFDSASQDYSIFSWIKRATNGTMYIISKEDADNYGWRMMFNSSNQVVCSEDITDVTSTSTITDTNWHHIGCTIDRDGNGQVYIDGLPNGSTSSMGSDAMATTSNIRIGTRSYTSINYFDGQIDDVRIYNYALTSKQVEMVYNDGAVNFGN
jgi:hypothetical protein